MSRKRQLKQELRVRINSELCIYCGDPATTDEHFPPYNCGELGWIFRCCDECNKLAHTNYAYNFQARAAYVVGKLKQRYKKELKFPDWNDSELASLEYGFRNSVLRSIEERQRARSRVSWDAVAYLATIDHTDALNLTPRQP